MILGWNQTTRQKETKERLENECFVIRCRLTSSLCGVFFILGVFISVNPCSAMASTVRFSAISTGSSGQEKIPFLWCSVMETKNPLKNISVVMPTLNCRYLIEPLAVQIRQLASAVAELIVVDSQSEDGTVEFLEATLEGLPYRVISRPRGLYASWNEGIAACREKWIYMATAGDIISTEELTFLGEVAAKTDADVVSGTPRFVDEDGKTLGDEKWPIIELFNRRTDEEIIEMHGLELVAFALLFCHPGGRTQSWLGSSASNLYKASCLQAHPFPEAVGPTGDVLWGLRHADKVRAVFCKRRCGHFVMHERAGGPILVHNKEVLAIYVEAWAEARNWLSQNFAEIGMGFEGRKLFMQLMEEELTRNTMTASLRKRRREIKYYKTYIKEVRARVPHYLHRFVFPKIEKPE